MSSIIIASVPIHGHVTPLLAVAEKFASRGDDVRFVTGSRFADRVRATGASFIPCSPKPTTTCRNSLTASPSAPP